LDTAYNAAAGPDGTLAVISGARQCVGGTTRSGAGELLLVKPGQAFVDARSDGVPELSTGGDSGVQQPGGLAFTRAFAAGGGRAVFGILRHTSAGYNSDAAGRACGPAGRPTAPYRLDAVGVATGEGGAGTVLATATGEGTSSPSGTDVSFRSASVDDAGNGALTAASNSFSAPHRLWLFGLPRAGGGGSGGGGGGSAGGAAGAAGSVPPGGNGMPPAVVRPVVAVAPPLAGVSAPVRYVGARPTRRGVDVTIRLPPESADRRTAVAFLLRFGVIRSGAARAAARSRPVTLAKATKTFRRTGRATIKLRYTTAGRRLLRSRRTLKATLRITTTIDGFRPRVVNRRLTLRSGR